MTLPKRRSSRPRGRARLAPVGDIPAASEAGTDPIGWARPADWDGRTYQWGGASDAGLNPADIYPLPAPPAIAPPAMPRGRSNYQPADFRPPGPHPIPPLTSGPDPRHDIIGGDMARGWARLFEIRCAYPAANHDTPIPCGAVYRDDAAASFRGLRRAAFGAGWHLDAFGRWACPRCCGLNPDYHTLYPLTHWHPHASPMRHADDLEGEFRLQVMAELDLRDRTLHHYDNSHKRGKRAGGAR